MPLVTEQEPKEERKRGRRWLWGLLAVPALLIGLLVVPIFRDVHFEFAGVVFTGGRSERFRTTAPPLFPEFSYEPVPVPDDSVYRTSDGSAYRLQGGSAASYSLDWRDQTVHWGWAPGRRVRHDE